MRMGLLLVTAVLALGSVSPAFARERVFSIGEEVFAENDIVDARAQPDVVGSASILLSFEEAAAVRLEKLTLRAVGKPLKIELNGQVLATSIVQAPIADGQIVIANAQWKLQDATVLAKQISGKDPLPESLDEGP